MLNKIFAKLKSINLNQIFRAFLLFILLITIICIFVPFSPLMPVSGLDQSWSFGMNQAVAQNLSLGKEVIFTFGPYASIYTKLFHPSTDILMVTGSLYLALSYWIYFVILIKKVKWPWIITLCAFFAGLIYSPDALLFSIPLLVGILTFKIISSKEENYIKNKWKPFFVALLFAPFGLLPLIKGSMLILCIAILILCIIFFIIKKQKKLAIISIMTPITSMFFFWIISGQSILNLPSYFINMIPISSGYTEAMAVNGPNYEIILYLLASAILLLIIFIQKKINNISKIFLFCIYFIFLFLAFKAGFVRHDGHAIISSTSILIATLLLLFISNSKIIFLGIIFTLITWASIFYHYNCDPSLKVLTEKKFNIINISTVVTSEFIHQFYNNIKLNYSSEWYGIKNRIQDKNWLKTKYDSATNSIREQTSFPVLQGTTDIYSYNQSNLIASGNIWAPRPVFQSYSAYTPKLAEINKQHLLGKKAPDNIIFRVEPIDGRIPSIEDGTSWPTILANYLPTKIKNDYLFLKKDNSIKIDNPVLLSKENHVFGETVDLPQLNNPIFAQIKIKPTFLGRIASILYKPSQINILVELNNGTKKQFRIIAGMAESGLIISPLIENTNEFGMLYSENNFLNQKSVKSITIDPDFRKSFFWNKNYNITFSEIKNVLHVNLSNIYNYDKFDNKLSNYNMATAENCDGVIDIINGINPIPSKLLISNFLEVSGWLATSTDKATLPDDVYVILTDNQGKNKYLKTQKVNRPDVGDYFKKTELSKSGYKIFADISNLDGKYILGLAINQSNNLELCPQFKIPITITNN